MTWRRFGVLVRHLPYESSTVRAIAGAKAEWLVSDYMLAAIIDLLAGANWQRTGRKANKPKPVPRPGEHEAKRQQLGGGGMSIEELNERLAAATAGSDGD